MGCGCRKKKSDTPAVPLTAAQQQAIREASVRRANKALSQIKQNTQIKQARLKQNLTVVNDRKILCDSCPLAIFKDKNADNKFKICSKCNRPIFIICADPNFACPIGKFTTFTN
jgi:hypothetical protein